MAKEYAQDYEVPKLPHVVFMTMLLNDAMKLGVLSRWMILVMESAVKELRGLGVIGVGSWKPIDRRSLVTRMKRSARDLTAKPLLLVMTARSEAQIAVTVEAVLVVIITIAFPPFKEIEEMADYVRENFRWHWRSASRPPRLLPEDYRELCLHFVLSKEAVRDFELSKMVQANFYAILLNDTVGLGIVSGFIAADLMTSLEERDIQSERRKMILFSNFTNTEKAAEYVRDTFRWSLTESSTLIPNPLPEDYHGLCRASTSAWRHSTPMTPTFRRWCR
ncbi:LOW QUALITY PROTEIN: hypothetical protein Cgig2_008074 [Carnegiea gigantea]|uniref:Uncharacterized protein n=1 Tax=Carnegiea gigantea TaxID=171969 RepID=A0A9Q1L204_9CARY|nr:LOW QUALITY PROTEIN: hypothetical protein Cgig2_008074 [Carnegiea gigantea]